MLKKTICTAIAALLSLFALSACQNTTPSSTPSPAESSQVSVSSSFTAASTLATELSKGNLTVSGDLITAFYQYNQRSDFNEFRLLPDMETGQAPDWDGLTLFAHTYCVATGISDSDNQYLTTKDAFDRVASQFFSGLKYDHRSSEYLILKDDGYYPRGFDLPDAVFYRLTGLSKDGNVYTAKFDGYVISESELSATGPRSGVSVSESVGPNMKAVMDYAKIQEINNGQTVRDTMLEIFKKDDYAKNLRLDQKLEITFELSGESEPALKYLSCHRKYVTTHGLLPEVDSSAASSVFPAQTTKEYLKTDPAKDDDYNAAIKVYNDFLCGNTSAKNKIAGHTNETLNINEMFNMSYKPGIDSYGLFDVNGDGIPELHSRSHSYNIFAYQNGELEQWYEYDASSSGYPYPLQNIAIFAVFTSTGRSYEYTTFSKDGTATKITFFDAASYDGEKVPENAPYYFNDKKVAKDEYETLTKEYIASSKKPASMEWQNYQ